MIVEAQSVRVIMVEPQGQGGICHYTYCLCAALEDSAQVATTLVTGDPYELSDAPRSFALAPAFGPGLERKAIQIALRRPDLRYNAQPVLRTTPATTPVTSSATAEATRASVAQPAQAPTATQPFQTTSLAGRASQLLANREADRGWKRAVGLARKHPETIVHIQWFTNPQRDYRQMEALRARGVPVVLTAHNVLPHDAAPEMRATWRRIYQSADAIIVHYQRALEELDSLGIGLENVSVVPFGNFSAIEELTRGSGDPATRKLAARQRLGIAPDVPVVLSFGLMRPYKGIQYLLPAFAAMRATYPDARLILAGRAPDGFASVQAEITRLGIDDATLSFPTYLPLHESAEVFEACDVVALPYVEASQSGVVQLAYAYSRPAVATRVGGIPEAVVDGKTGALIEPRDSDALAQALTQILGDREQCAELGRQARRYADEQFAWGPIAQQTRLIYERIGRGGKAHGKHGK